MLVDAHNAFNKLNRKVSLENNKRLCSLICTYLHNSYNTPKTLYVENRNHIYMVTVSQGGVTQGGNAAMAMYALSTQPLTQALSNEIANDKVKQVCYAVEFCTGWNFLFAPAPQNLNPPHNRMNLRNLACSGRLSLTTNKIKSVIVFIGKQTKTVPQIWSLAVNRFEVIKNTFWFSCE